MRKNLPKSIDEIEFVSFVGRDIDLNTKGKPSVYLRNVIIPYYRKVIRGLDKEIVELRKSKKALLERKNKQISAKRWLTYKSNQKKYAVQQSKVRKKAAELTEKKFRRAALKHQDMMQSVLFYPVVLNVAKREGIKIDELIYIIYTWNFMFLSIDDYKSYFKEAFKMGTINSCKSKGYLDVQRSNYNQYYLSLKGKNLVKSIIEEFNTLKDGEA